MAEVKASIVITGIGCLTIIYITMILSHEVNDIIGTAIISAIALSIGVLIPTTKIDNTRGVLKW